MPAITITFWGICTYLREHERFVLVQASQAVIDGNPNLAGKGIHPHHARLHLHSEDVVSIGPLSADSLPAGMLVFDLDMVTLTIANPDLPAAVDADGNDCAPHLRNFANGPLSEPTDDALHGGPSIAAALDVPSGALQSFRKDSESGACVNVLITQTIGDPMLSLTPFGSSTATTITLRPGASVLLSNLPHQGEGADRDEDFLLHFLTCTSFPPLPSFPSGEGYTDCHVSHTLENGGIEQYVGPGCSNTNYP